MAYNSTIDKATDDILIYGNTVKDGSGTSYVPLLDADGHQQIDVLTLPAIPAGTNNIGDVDVLTINGVAPAFGTGLRGATVQRVTIATDDSVPVTNAGITTIAGAVSGTEMQVDVLTMPTTTVTATDLDIRNLVAATDIVDLGGNALTSLQLLDDTVATLGTTTYTEAATKGNIMGAVRRDANTTLVDTTNEVAPLQVNATGELKVAQIQALPAGTNNIGDVDILSIAAGDNNIGNVDIVSGTITTVTTLTGGGVAHDGIDSGNPHKIGGKAVSTAPTDVAANDRVDGWFDLKGRQIVASKSATGTQTTVASSATNVTLLAANTARLGATIYNDSTAILYLRLQATATTSNFTTKLFADDYYEVPAGYAGIIDGIWASATGNARITELT